MKILFFKINESIWITFSSCKLESRNVSFHNSVHYLISKLEFYNCKFIFQKVNARDRDDNGDNGRVSYHFKVANENVGETSEFMIDNETGEVRAKIMFDR